MRYSSLLKSNRDNISFEIINTIFTVAELY